MRSSSSRRAETCSAQEIIEVGAIVLSLGTLLHNRSYLRHWLERSMTGHLPAISAIFPRSSSETSLSMEMTRSKRSILPAAATFQFGAFLAILRMDFGVRDVNADAPEGQLLVTGIEAQRHSGAGAKRNSKEVVERWSEIETAF